MTEMESSALLGNRFYHRYPFYFQGFFQGLSPEGTQQLADIGFPIYRFALDWDAWIDGDIEEVRDGTWKDLFKALSRLARMDESERCLGAFMARFEEFRSSRFMEMDFVRRGTVCYREMERLAERKSALALLAIDCLSIMARGKPRMPMANLLESHRLFTVAVQLYDDIRDFREDAVAGRFNWAIWMDGSFAGQRISEEQAEVGYRRFLYRGEADTLLKRASENLAQAGELLPKDRWAKPWNGILERIRAQLDRLARAIGKERARSELRKEIADSTSEARPGWGYPSDLEPWTRRGLRFIERDWASGWPLLTHLLELPRKDGFTRFGMQRATLFQRAMMLEFLQPVASGLGVELNDYVERETAWIYGQRSQGPVGGWAYVKGVAELAADIDDLGTVMRAFLIADKRAVIKRFVERPIQIAIEDRKTQDGGLETWILPTRLEDGRQRLQQSFNDRLWGRGPDVEVVANFLLALEQWDPLRYRRTIELGKGFVLSRLGEKPPWTGRWYVGNLYPIYICTRLLADNPQVGKRVLGFLEKNQCGDGGFRLGPGKGADPLSTAWAILTLRALDFEGEVRSRAESWLLEAQRKDGSWASVPFISPRPDQPYGSSTLTTMIALHALVPSACGL